MRWSLHLFTVRGIKIYLHYTFVLLLAWLGYVYYAQTGDPMMIVRGVLLGLILFALIVLHELGHSLTGQKFGIETKDIILLPIGGMSRMSQLPENPVHEFIIAVAGPLVNVVLAVILGLYISYVQNVDLWAPAAISGGLLHNLFWINVVLAIFNLLPAFPMDGGRVLRALVSIKIGRVRATRVAASIGHIFAIAFGIIGLASNPILLLIAVFIWFGANQEYASVQMSRSFRGLIAMDIMARDFRVLAGDDKIEQAARFIIDGFQHDFPVMKDGHIIGVLTRKNLLKGISEQGSHIEVSSIMETNFETVITTSTVEEVIQKLQSSACPLVPVLRNEQLVGIVSLEHLSEFLMLRSAKRGKVN